MPSPPRRGRGGGAAARPSRPDTARRRRPRGAGGRRPVRSRNTRPSGVSGTRPMPTSLLTMHDVRPAPRQHREQRADPILRRRRPSRRRTSRFDIQIVRQSTRMTSCSRSAASASGSARGSSRVSKAAPRSARWRAMRSRISSSEARRSRRTAGAARAPGARASAKRLLPERAPPPIKIRRGAGVIGHAPFGRRAATGSGRRPRPGCACRGSGARSRSRRTAGAGWRGSRRRRRPDRSCPRSTSSATALERGSNARCRMLGLMSEARNAIEIRCSSSSLVARTSAGTCVPLRSA